MIVRCGVIKEVKNILDVFIWNIFFVWKKLRLIINLKYFNEFVKYYYFKEEIVIYVLKLI